MRFYAILAMSAFAAVASAQYVVVPGAYAGTAGNAGLNTFVRDVGATRAGQLLIGSTMLGGVNVGDQITGLTFRLYTGATTAFPPAGATWAQYDIFMGESVAPAARSTTFASNVIGSLSQVRSGPLTMTANSFSVGGSPNTWGYEINFTTPYTYTGGNLLIEIRHGGSDIVNPTGTFLDALATTTAGYGTDFASVTAGTSTATTGADASFTITRLSVAPVPEPASMAALGLGVVALIRRRRQAK